MKELKKLRKELETLNNLIDNEADPDTASLIEDSISIVKKDINKLLEENGKKAEFLV